MRAATSLERDYRTHLLKLHERVLDPAIEQLFFADHDRVLLGPHHFAATIALMATITAIAVPAGRAVDPQLIDATCRGSPSSITVQGVLLLASQYPFQAIGGVEFAEELHDDATANIAQFPRSRMKCRNVECVLDDAAAAGSPDGESVHYFLNPFSRELFAEVLDIVVSYRNRPRRLYLILVDPIGTDPSTRAPACSSATPCRKSSASRVKAFSLYEVAVYRTLALP